MAHGLSSQQKKSLRIKEEKRECKGSVGCVHEGAA